MPSHPRLIPSIEQLRQRPSVQRLEVRYGREATVQALRDEAAALRRQLAAAQVGIRDAEDAAARIEAGLAPRLDAALAPSLRPVVNATGVIVHTNLGRAPLGRPAIERIAAVAGGYTNLEYDLAAGRRGSRAVHASRLVARLTGAEAAVVVNNNAAAVLLTLNTLALAAGREVIRFRGGSWSRSAARFRDARHASARAGCEAPWRSAPPTAPTKGRFREQPIGDRTDRSC